MNTEALTLADLWNTVWRNKKMIAFVTLLFGMFGLLYGQMAPKIYKAESVLLMDNQKKNVEIKSVLSDIPNDQSLVPSEIQVLISRNLMEKVLLEMGDLQALPYNASSDDRIAYESKIEKAQDTLSVTQIEKSRAISVSYYSREAKKSAQLVNTLTKLYIEQQISNNFDAVRLTNEWLSDRVSELQEKVRASEQKVADYRAKTGLVDNQDGGLAEQDITNLSQRLNDAKVRLAAAEAKLTEVDDKKKLSAAPSVLSSTLIQKLRESESDARAEYASLSKTLGSNHPQLLEAKAKLGAIQSRISSEITKIADGVRSEYTSALENVSLIEKQIASLKDTYNSDKAENVDLAALEREAETNRKFLETISLRWKETQSQEDRKFQEPYARVISTASIPAYPESPKKKIILLASLLAGLAFGSGLALIRDQFENTIYNGKQIQDMTSITNISMIVKAQNEKGQQPHFSELPINGQSERYMNGVKDVSAFLKLYRAKNPNEKVFCVSSSVKDEGKSSLVASLSRQLSLEGYKVLAIDCDMRGQSLTKMFGLDNSAGLTELLSGQSHLRDVITHDGQGKLFVMPIGAEKQDYRLLNQGPEVWKKIVDEASKDFDYILIDNSYALTSPEARVISSIGKNIFCIRWKKTPLRAVNYALDSLKRNDAAVIGTVLTLVEDKEKTGQKAA